MRNVLEDNHLTLERKVEVFLPSVLAMFSIVESVKTCHEFWGKNTLQCACDIKACMILHVNLLIK